MKNTLNLLEKVISFLLENKIKHNHTKFSSGIVILDVWYNEKFYVFHFESNHIGISEVDNNVAFDSKADKIIEDEKLFENELISIFKPIY
ncbi:MULTISPECIES: hypothetical protein [Sphingobacterium]|uniref:hypothetical protein n=1 Tax=Sphingobacterium TaxID=28453 RepID=UPI001044AF3E|nr:MULTISPECIES: hypothetical protein [Sphingobacterium]MCW2260155.1 K+-sensing histidine kinase KdpD [Sphingobacterium kitahiroshimense]TCR11054.1 hypothetical protein EDF67_104147 [Sphingobacterium sp. JUb78]